MTTFQLKTTLLMSFGNPCATIAPQQWDYNYLGKCTTCTREKKYGDSGTIISVFWEGLQQYFGMGQCESPIHTISFALPPKRWTRWRSRLCHLIPQFHMKSSHPWLYERCLVIWGIIMLLQKRVLLNLFPHSWNQMKGYGGSTIAKKSVKTELISVNFDRGYLIKWEKWGRRCSWCWIRSTAWSKAVPKERLHNTFVTPSTECPHCPNMTSTYIRFRDDAE